jgi:hemoglobin
MAEGEPGSVFEAAGGEETFARLVEAFYEGVVADPLLRPMYPEEDLAGAKERLFLFLIQLFGGPRRYEAQRGHPRLRARHLPFSVGIAERDAWLTHMRAAMYQVGIEEPARTPMLEYFDRAADFMRNRPE